jgi:hypothetical protein
LLQLLHTEGLERPLRFLFLQVKAAIRHHILLGLSPVLALPFI